MGLISNVVSSVTGKIDKALLCVKKPAAAKVNTGINSMLGAVGASLDTGLFPLLGGASSNVDLRAKMAASQKGFLSSFTSMKNVAKQEGYHVMEVKYNPSRIRIQSHGGNQMMPGPAGAGANLQMQSTIPAMTTMQVELLFDDMNKQDAFMMEKISDVSAGAIVSDISGVVKNIIGDGYTVQREIEGIIGMITQSETRQVVFYWGDMAFAGEVIGIEAKYTMFNPLGHPVRGTVSLTIREGGPDGDSSGNAYWDDAYKEMMKGGGLLGKLAGAAGNLLNLK